MQKSISFNREKSFLKISPKGDLVLKKAELFYQVNEKHLKECYPLERIRHA
jgi:hypothetical protein